MSGVDNIILPVDTADSLNQEILSYYTTAGLSIIQTREEKILLSRIKDVSKLSDDEFAAKTYLLDRTKPDTNK
jgi:hypothetical protein